MAEEDIYVDVCGICDQVILPSQERETEFIGGDAPVLVHRKCYEALKPIKTSNLS